MHTRHHPAGATAVAAALALLAASFLPACRSGVSLEVEGAYQPVPPGGLDYGTFSQTPRPRLGCLPWPGLFTLFDTADPNNLGHHAYDNQSGAPETDRGIIYSCDGGFIDIAHVRKSIDMCKYVQVRVNAALLNDWTALRIKALEPTVYTLRFQYPPYWKTLPPDEKKLLSEELSIRIGQRMGMLVLSWHELLTWFGYQSTPLISERASAFTWDDTGGHAFGVVMVAGRALREHRIWDDAVTDAISDGLRELGAMPPEQTIDAVSLVEEHWWSGNEPLKRDIDMGWNGQPIIPWLVPNVPFCHDPVPHRYLLPTLNDVMGRDFRELLRIEIEPNVWETDRIRGTIPGKPELIDADKDVPVILNYIRNWYLGHDGAHSLDPY